MRAVSLSGNWLADVIMVKVVDFLGGSILISKVASWFIVLGLGLVLLGLEKRLRMRKIAAVIMNICWCGKDSLLLIMKGKNFFLQIGESV